MKGDIPVPGENTRSLRYGWGKFRPQILQSINNSKCFLLFLVGFSTFQGMTVNGLTNLNLQVLEKRFQLSGKDIGFIAASNDISGIVLICFVSFYGTYGNKPKWLSFGSLMTGLGCFLFTLPHILIDRYEPEVGATANSKAADVCNPNSTQNETQAQAQACFSGYTGDWHYLFIFSVAQIIMGAGTTPLYALGPAYLDENVSPKSAPVYLGLFYCTVFVGPGIGYMLGGTILEIWVDIEMPEGLGLTPKDPRWIGAWWIGYLIGGLVLTLNSLFLLGFPYELPGSKELRDKAISEGNLPKRDETIKGNFKDIAPATIRLFKNPTYVFNTVGVTAQSLFGGGFLPFLPKFTQMKYAVNPKALGFKLGLVTLVGGGAGTFTGGLIVRRFNLKTSCKKSAKYCFIFAVVTIPLSLLFFVPGCTEVPLAGITKSYHHSSTDNPSLLSACNANCSCSAAGINPVCGDDQLVYFSPCHAGCKHSEGQRSLTNCACVLPSRNATRSGAERGYCDRGPGCQNVYGFLVMMVVALITVVLAAIPNKTVCLRSVPDNQRAYALGLQFIFQRSLGLLPGPLLFGAVFDWNCILWGESCGMRGSCQLHDVWLLSLSMAIIRLIVNGLMILSSFLAYWYCKQSYEDPVENQENGGQKNQFHRPGISEQEAVM